LRKWKKHIKLARKPTTAKTEIECRSAHWQASF
jgi:hypothetical protein